MARLRVVLGLAALLLTVGAACAPQPPATSSPAAGPPAGPTEVPAAGSVAPPTGAAAVTAPTRLVVRHANTSLSTTHAPYWIAEDAGYFAEEGLDYQVSYIQGSSVAIQSLIAGEVDTLSISGSTTVQAAASGADALIVAMNVGTVTLHLVSVPDIRAPEQLRGQPVGITRFGTIGDVAIRLLLRRWGMEAGADVPLVQVGGQAEAVAAMQSGAARAVMTADLQATQLEQQGYHELFDAADLGLEYPGHTTTTSRRFADAHPEVIRRFLRALARGMGRFVNDEDYSLAVMQKRTGIDSPAVLKKSWELHTQRYIQRSLLVTPEAIRSVLQELAGDERVQAADPTSFYDNHWVQELHDSGFMAQVYAR